MWLWIGTVGGVHEVLFSHTGCHSVYFPVCYSADYCRGCSSSSSLVRDSKRCHRPPLRQRPCDEVEVLKAGARLLALPLRGETLEERALEIELQVDWHAGRIADLEHEESVVLLGDASAATVIVRYGELVHPDDAVDEGVWVRTDVEVVGEQVRLHESRLSGTDCLDDVAAVRGQEEELTGPRVGVQC